MPRNPKATRPKAKTAGASIRVMPSGPEKPSVETAKAPPMSAAMTRPIQKAEKLPAVRPARTLSDAPPSREAVTISLTWPEDVEVKTFTISGMMAPASVPQVMMVESFHHTVPSPSSAMSAYASA